MTASQQEDAGSVMLNYPAFHSVVNLEQQMTQNSPYAQLQSSASPTRTDIKVTVPGDVERAQRGQADQDDGKQGATLTQPAGAPLGKMAAIAVEDNTLENEGTHAEETDNRFVE